MSESRVAEVLRQLRRKGRVVAFDADGDELFMAKRYGNAPGVFLLRERMAQG